jgi:hypothetical protein
MAIARLTGIAESGAAGFRGGTFTREAALPEIAAISTEPDVLAEAASGYVAGDQWFGQRAVELLIEAGADQDAIVRYVEHRNAGWRGFDLQRLADEANRLRSVGD